MSQPWYLDQFWRHFRGRGHDGASGTTATTLASAAAEGDLTLAATSATGFTVGEFIVVGSGTVWQTFIITAIASNTLTVVPKVQPGGFAGGTTLQHGWNTDALPGSVPAYTAIAAMMATVKQSSCRGGRNRIGPVFGQLETGYTDAFTSPNVPVGWQSLAFSAAFQAVPYATADIPAKARSGNGMLVPGVGMTNLVPMPVTPGERYVIQAQTRTLTGGGSTWQMNMQDLGVPGGPLGQLADPISGTASQNAGVFGPPSALAVTIPDGVTTIGVRFVRTFGTDSIYLDDVRVIRDMQLPGEDRYLFEDPGVTQGIAWLGDDWGTGGASGLASLFQSQLQTRIGNSFPFTNASVAGNTLTSMIARFDTDIRPTGAAYCVIQYGSNDLAAAQSQAVMESNADTIIQLCRSARMIPVFLGLPPYQPQIALAQARNEQVRARIDNAVFEPGWRNENGPPPPDKQ